MSDSFETLWNVACQATLSMEISQGRSGVGCHFLFQGGLTDTGVGLVSPVSPALAGGSFTTEAPGKRT